MEDIAAQARQFADALTQTVSAVCHNTPAFGVGISSRKGTFLATVRPKEEASIPLTIGGVHLLDLNVSFRCAASGRHGYMVVEESAFHLRPHGGGEVLLRQEYVRNPSSSIPCSHLHVHAHRDAWTFMMARDGQGSSRRAVRSRGAALKTPQLSDVHFPLGGPRMRPALEDFLEMLIHDLGIDHKPGALEILAAERAAWRREQTRSVIGADRDLAAEVLRDAGWSVTPPQGYEPRSEPPAWLSTY